MSVVDILIRVGVLFFVIGLAAWEARRLYTTWYLDYNEPYTGPKDTTWDLDYNEPYTGPKEKSRANLKLVVNNRREK